MHLFEGIIGAFKIYILYISNTQILWRGCRNSFAWKPKPGWKFSIFISIIVTTFDHHNHHYHHHHHHYDRHNHTIIMDECDVICKRRCYPTHGSLKTPYMALIATSNHLHHYLCCLHHLHYLHLLQHLHVYNFNSYFFRMIICLL